MFAVSDLPKTAPFSTTRLEEVADDYEIVGPFVLEASELGAATKRPRLFVIGFRS